MSIRIALRGGGYTATVTPPHGDTSKWESGAPVTGRELVDALLKLGCHQTDIADAFDATDPDWMEHLDRPPLQAPSLRPDERAALTAVLCYWQEHWDWECPTLFGLELTEYQDAVATWQASADPSQPQVAHALLGALREFLHGASAVRATDVSGITGMPKPDLLALEKRIGPYVFRIVDSDARSNTC